MLDIKTILVTTDFSAVSEKAFAPAVALARIHGARILVAYVEEDRVPPLYFEYAGISEHELREQQQRHVREKLAALVASEIGDDVETELIVGVGIPHHEIVRMAETHDVDLIVMATHGRGLVTHALLGSTTERVIRRAPCAVYVARGKEQREE